MLETRIRVAVQAEPSRLGQWLMLLSETERLGFSAILVGDHPGNGLSPWGPLAIAASVTSKISLGPYVLNCGVRHVLDIAFEAASLNCMAPGRVRLGLGAGHTPQEWSQYGGFRPDVKDRVDRLIEFTEILSRIFDGEVVDHESEHASLQSASLANMPRCESESKKIGIVLGGNNQRILMAAARYADTVGMSGLGKTLADGHRHELKWDRSFLKNQLAVIGAQEIAEGRRVRREALVQRVILTEDRVDAARSLSRTLRAGSVENLLNTPYLLIGTHDQMLQQLFEQSERWGISDYVIREDAMMEIAPILAQLK